MKNSLNYSPSNNKKGLHLVGYALLLSPIGNFLITTLHSRNRILENIQLITFESWVFFALAAISGSLLIRNIRYSWIPAMATLGLYFLRGIMNLNSDFHQGQGLNSALALLVNAGLMFFLYWSEVPKKPKETSFELSWNEGVPLDFEGWGKFGKVLRINSNEVSIELTEAPLSSDTRPPDIETKIVELELLQGLTVRARFSRQEEKLMIFQLLEPSHEIQRKITLYKQSR